MDLHISTLDLHISSLDLHRSTLDLHGSHPGLPIHPANINKRLSRNSPNEEVFKAVCEPYQKAIDESEYKFNLKFDPHARDANPRQKKKRNRRITWLNPPFSLNVKTNVGAVFLQIVKECLHRNHKLYKICNRNTLKMSYRTTNNMSTFVSKHNRRILKQYHDQQQAVDPKLQIHCNCPATDKPQCWLPDRCTITNLVYRATITRLDTIDDNNFGFYEEKQAQNTYK